MALRFQMLRKTVLGLWTLKQMDSEIDGSQIVHAEINGSQTVEAVIFCSRIVEAETDEQID